MRAVLNYPPVRMLATAAALLAASWIWGRGLRPADPPPASLNAEEAAALIAARRPTLDPARAHRVHQAVDYDAGPAAPWYPRAEAPVLAELAQAGVLPPVAERVGPEPLVLRGPDGPGVYGGIWSDAVTWDAQTWDRMNRYNAGTTLARWSPSGYPIVPHVAKSWETSADQRTWTFHLRRGMRWSDGHPFTADDFTYWYEWEMLYFQRLGYALNDDGYRLLRSGGEYGRVEKVDDYTVRFVFPRPNPFFLELVAGTSVKELFAPRHYLEKYHPELGDRTLIGEIMRRRRLTAPHQVYLEVKREDNPEHPRLNAWIYRRYQPHAPHAFVRNPYYWAVDETGRQLPNIDQITMEVITPELVALRAAAGSLPAAFETTDLGFANYGLFMGARRRHGFDVRHYYSGQSSLWSIIPNQNLYHEPGDAVGRQKAELLQRLEFRQALSLALNRRAIIRAEFFGFGEPAQVAPAPESPFHHPGLYRAFVEYDPARANALLDGLGLTRRDADGFRTLPDGSPMVWTLPYPPNTAPGPFQFVLDDWAAVGIRALARPVTTGLMVTMRMATANEFAVHPGYVDFVPVIDAKSYVPLDRFAHYAPVYGTWYDSQLQTGNLRAQARATAPPADSPFREAFRRYEAAMEAPSREEGIRRFSRLLDISATNLWIISLSSPPPAIALVRDDFRNVPAQGISGNVFHTPLNLGVETFYFQRPAMSPGAYQQLKADLTTIQPSPVLAAGEAARQQDEHQVVGRLLRWLIVGIVAAAGVLVGLRHPYIGRRLLLFIPVLLVVSVTTFVIIQIPPGNIIETRLVSLEQSGTSVSQQEIARLRAQFHLDDSLPERYLRWIGAHWFLTFRDADRGLLQGDLGLSMIDPRRPQRVNELVGDRLLFTILLSAGTILFTWTLALPIGIYSAVRQYSPADYALTFLGFVGMSVPGFLLALLLMYWG
ncbi:MAG: hypothetical protein JNG83_00380, partial [Opitutaceae bacterium]|nr:hypothetical protein [Opitutaceae bacterium]